MKYLLIIGDGMADNVLPELGGKTPLEYAKIPAMDVLAGAGTLGTVRTVPEGMTAGSDTAILSIFGCDPKLHYGGRAPLEAAASGIVLNPGDVAYRCNMISIEDSDLPFEQKRILSHSAGSIEGDISDLLITELFDTSGFKELAQQAGFIIYPGGSFRHIAVQGNAQLTSNTVLTSTTGRASPPPTIATGRAGARPLQRFHTDSNSTLTLTPPHDHLGEIIGPLLPSGGENARVLTSLMEKAHHILDKHPVNMKRREAGLLPANGIWFWAQGVAVPLLNFKEKYGKTGCVVSAVPLCQGIGALMGLDIITVEGATGELDTNYEGKVEAALNALETRDFVTVHIEAPDECTHNGDLKGKLEAIERIDARVVAPLVNGLAASKLEFRMLVISDHRTLMSTRGHSGEPVPFILYDNRKIEANNPGCSAAHSLRYCEADAEAGVHVKDGTLLMGMLFDE